MQRDNRPTLPPGTIAACPSPETVRSHRNPNPNPNLIIPPPPPPPPATEEARRAYLRADAHRVTSVAHQALIQGNSRPEAANYPPPPRTPIGLATQPASSPSFLDLDAHTNGIAPSGMSTLTTPVSLNIQLSYSPDSSLHYQTNSTSPTAHRRAAKIDPVFNSASSTATGSPFYPPPGSLFGPPSAVSNASSDALYFGIPQLDGAASRTSRQPAVNPAAGTSSQQNSHQVTATAPTSVPASSPAAQAVTALDQSGAADLTIDDAISGSPAPESGDNPQ
ncbi:uncharacterized protein RSE6_08421 [Rhynchosporium secalis]|uniref:Uncharacterized protein n=1 Tax=Rhynchosporium secalis TaxID=38038 RepID=A0A1E1MFD0_RHYSE|nr:uncharacterized protein RSE6_08421 [Rhynchosporium secalis]